MMKWNQAVAVGILVLVGIVVWLTIGEMGADDNENDLRAEMMRLRSQLEDQDGELEWMRERLRAAMAEPPAERSVRIPASLPAPPAVLADPAEAEIAAFRAEAKKLLARYEDIEPLRGTIEFRDEMKIHSPWMILHTLVPEDFDRALEAYITDQLEIWTNREGPLAEEDRKGYVENMRRYLVVATDLQRRAATLRAELEGDVPMADEYRKKRRERLNELMVEIGGLRRRGITNQSRYLRHKPKD